jgi:hypothetical protein
VIGEESVLGMEGLDARRRVDLEEERRRAGVHLNDSAPPRSIGAKAGSRSLFLRSQIGKELAHRGNVERRPETGEEWIVRQHPDSHLAIGPCYDTDFFRNISDHGHDVVRPGEAATVRGDPVSHGEALPRSPGGLDRPERLDLRPSTGVNRINRAGNRRVGQLVKAGEGVIGGTGACVDGGHNRDTG